MAFSRSDQNAGEPVDIRSVRWFASVVSDPTVDAAPSRIRLDTGGRGDPADDFLAEVCHRVRTPLNGILGSLELLLESDLPDDVRVLAATAFDSARDLHRVFESEVEAVRGPAELQQR